MMPMHFGELKNLHVLNTFFVDRNSELSTKQLGELGGLNLHGRLSIIDLQNVFNPLDALKANLKNKHLVELGLIWKSNHIPYDPRKEKKVLENLHPHKHLEHLLIMNYSGTKFPSWVFDNSLSNLVFLRLVDCKNCICLPLLGVLSCLKTLEIRGLDGIVSIGAEVYGSNSSFASLERLHFYDMKEWEEWECKTTSFPRLKLLCMQNCPKVKGLPEQLLHLNTSALEILHIDSCLLLNIPMIHFNLLHEMRISGGCHSLTIFWLDFFPNLRLLELRMCQNLRRISQEQAHNHLITLAIIDCPRFESFLSEGLSAQLIGVENLKFLPKPMQILFPSLTKLWIIDCPKVEMFPAGGLPLNVKYVSLSSLKLIASLREALDANTCLETLYIKKLDVECIPDEVLLPCSLTSLRIYDCPNLKKMHYKGLCHLSSVILDNCPSLQCLAEEGLPKSMSSLSIRSCPLLKERCQNPDGEDWRKIAHIQKLDVE